MESCVARPRRVAASLNLNANLKYEVGRESFEVFSQLLIEPLGGDAKERRKADRAWFRAKWWTRGTSGAHCREAKLRTRALAVFAVSHAQYLEGCSRP